MSLREALQRSVVNERHEPLQIAEKRCLVDVERHKSRWDLAVVKVCDHYLKAHLPKDVKSGDLPLPYAVPD